MNIRFNNIIHIAKSVVDHSVGADAINGPWRSCCSVDAPCVPHDRALMWMVGTACGYAFPVKGRPKGDKATCLACLAAT